MFDHQDNDYSDFSDHVNVIIRERERNRSVHVEHVDESSNFSRHFHRQFADASIDFQIFHMSAFAYAFTNVQRSSIQRSSSSIRANSRISAAVFDESSVLNNILSAWSNFSRQQRLMTQLMMQFSMQSIIEKRLIRLENEMSLLQNDMTTMQTSLNKIQNIMQKFDNKSKSQSIEHMNIRRAYQTFHAFFTSSNEHQNEIVQSSKFSKFQHLQTMSVTKKFRASNLNFFNFNLFVTSEYPVDDVINSEKYTIYRDVTLFVQQIKRIARINVENIAFHLHECLRKSAMQWFSSLLKFMQNRLSSNVDTFCNRLIQKYKMTISQTLDKLYNEHYIMIDAQKLRFAKNYMQTVLRYARVAQLSEQTTLIVIWKNLDFELSRDVDASRYDDDQNSFVRRIEQTAELWVIKSSQIAVDREKVAYQRDLKLRQQQSQQSQQTEYQQQEYQSQNDSNRQQYQRSSRSERNQIVTSSNNYNISANATSIFDSAREYVTLSIYVPNQKLLINIVEVVEINENEANEINIYFVDEKIDLVEIFFNDFAFQQEMQSLFSCMKCARK